MKIGDDFFDWMNFIIRLIQIFMEVFGDDHEKEIAKNNHVAHK